jgi:hypothetical protein
MDVPFARHTVRIFMSTEPKDANNGIKLDLVLPYDRSETIEGLETRILQEAKKLLAEAEHELAGKMLPELYATDAFDRG